MPQLRQGRPVSDQFFVFEKAVYQLKASVQHHSFNIFEWSTTWIYNKANCRKVQFVDQGNIRFLFFRNGFGTSFFITFCA